MAAEQTTSRLDAAARVSAALLGTLPVALFASLCLGRFLPTDLDTRFAIAHALAIPLWVAAMCVASLARSGLRAWGACLALSAVLGGAALMIPG